MLGTFPHFIPWNLINDFQNRRDLIWRHILSQHIPHIFQFQFVRATCQSDNRSNSLAPFFVFQAHNSSFINNGQTQQLSLHIESRDLVSPTLYYIHTGTSLNEKCTLMRLTRNRNIASLEEAVFREFLCSRLGLPPIFQEHIITLDLDLTRLVIRFCDILVGPICRNKSNRDSWQCPSNTPVYPFLRFISI